MVLNNLATILARKHEYMAALERLAEALALQRQAGSLTGQFTCLDTWAAITCAIARCEMGVRVFSAVGVWRDAFMAPRLLCDQAEYELALQRANSELEPSVFQSAWDNGRTMTLEEAMAYTEREILRFKREA
jgi:hypothetical protein